MKLIHKILLVILALMIVFNLWLNLGASLKGRATCASAQAAEQREAFDAAASIVRSGAALQVFSDAALDSAEGYELLDANIYLSNKGLFDAEWLEITVNPGEGDVAVYSTSGAMGTVPAMGDGQVNVKLLSKNSGASRSVTIRYYVLGMYKSVTVPIK